MVGRRCYSEIWVGDGLERCGTPLHTIRCNIGGPPYLAWMFSERNPIEVNRYIANALLVHYLKKK